MNRKKTQNKEISLTIPKKYTTFAVFIIKINIMVELVLKSDVKKEKMEALLYFLKSWDIDVEIKNTHRSKTMENNNDLSLSVGVWKDYDIDATELRKQAWKITE